MVLVPYIGVPLYLLFGGRKLRSRAGLKEKLRAPRAALAPDQGRLATMLCAFGAAPPSHGNTLALLTSGEAAFGDRIYDAVLSGAFDAKQRLWVATPYFVPDEALLRALVLASRRGVDVRVVVPRRSNHLTADLAGASYLRALAREGGVVQCYGPEMLHAKLVLIDADVAILGSANMDMRSLFLDYEIALVVTSAQHVAELRTWYEAVLARCSALTEASRGRALLESVARLLAPLE